MIRPISTFTILPALPPQLERLRALAYNLHWSWHHETVEVFRHLANGVWEESGHNPVLMLGLVPAERLEEAARDEAFLAHLDRAWASHEEYLARQQTWYGRLRRRDRRQLVAYFSMEFGLTEALPIYSGGLGVLAGDHLKAASDLGLDLVGVGLLYQQGYFRQRLNPDGWQEEHYPVNDFSVMPLTPLRGADGAPLTVSVSLPERDVVARLWKAEVGRVSLIMLNTNLPENAPGDRAITDRLYNSDLDVRIRQEIVLGIGGMRALRALRLEPEVCHLNEGHSAFMILERIRLLMEEQHLAFAAAREIVRAGTVFTTHTPVPAGIDRFPAGMVAHYFGRYCEQMGLCVEELLALGREQQGDSQAPFSPTILALRLAAHANGVSRLHGAVSRRMFQVLWPGVPEPEVPIDSVTNGVHALSVISNEMASLYERYLGPRWREEPGDQSVWASVDKMPAEELWRTHERRRERLVAFARRRLMAQLRRHGASLGQQERAGEVLDPEALTIGFARRFATYKRGTLLLRDPARLSRLLNRPGQPVQIIFAGKAHPADEPAKLLIRELVQKSRQHEFGNRLVFIEDYDLTVARYMLQGCDLWLNTPRRPLEASGTSGMKAAANGVLNLSTLDGWWAEAYQPGLGWAIGNEETDVEDDERRDRLEAEALYNILEHEVIPLFYDRGRDGLPRRWIACMKAAIRTLCPVYSANRMITEYAERYYRPAMARVAELSAEDGRQASSLAGWIVRIQSAWGQVGFEGVTIEARQEIMAGDSVVVQARLRLGSLTPEDVSVQAYWGRLLPGGDIDPEAASFTPLGLQEEVAPGVYAFAGRIQVQGGGAGGITLRAFPKWPEPSPAWRLPLVCWASP
ncbi:MAG: alpha-glucan family phosphorylase [Anaerolineae bacterium]